MFCFHLNAFALRKNCVHTYYNTFETQRHKGARTQRIVFTFATLRPEVLALIIYCTYLLLEYDV